MADPILQTQDNVSVSLEQRFQQGDTAALDEVIRLYLPKIRQLVNRLLAWNGEVDDIVQDVFVAAFQNRKKFRAESNLKTWLYAIAVRHCRTRNYRRMIWQKIIRMQSNEKISLQTPLAASLRTEQIAQLRRAVCRLPVKYRDVIVLKYLEELPAGRILEILNITENTFYTRLNRGRAFLQQDLSDGSEIDS